VYSTILAAYAQQFSFIKKTAMISKLEFSNTTLGVETTSVSDICESGKYISSQITAICAVAHRLRTNFGEAGSPFTFTCRPENTSSHIEILGPCSDHGIEIVYV